MTFKKVILNVYIS